MHFLLLLLPRLPLLLITTNEMIVKIVVKCGFLLLPRRLFFTVCSLSTIARRWLAILMRLSLHFMSSQRVPSGGAHTRSMGLKYLGKSLIDD
jgi:hypothetical protein